MKDNQDFCAEIARRSLVEIIGSASEHQVYVAIEFPPPWAAYTRHWERLPEPLRQLMNEMDYQFLLIYNPNYAQANLVRVLIFTQPKGQCNAYQKLEFHLSHIDQVTPLLVDYHQGTIVNSLILNNKRDILICTHGVRDRCCARWGLPLFHFANQIVADRGLDSVRIWQSSHFGGHRMAPTAIDFPEGRYYGYLDRDSFETILTRSQNVSCLQQIYRGWGLLPWAVQVLEKQLLLQQGWDWLQYSVWGEIVSQNDDETESNVRLTVITNDRQQWEYTATITIDRDKTTHLKGSCFGEEPEKVLSYDVKNLNTPFKTSLTKS